MKFAIEIRNSTGEVILNKHLQKEKYTIGRGPDNDIWIPDAALDLYHAELHIRQNVLYIIDLNSENGTLKNGHIVSPGKEGMELDDSDKVLVGQHIVFVTANKDVESQLLQVIDEEEDGSSGSDSMRRTMAIGTADLDSNLFSGIVAIKKLNPRLLYFVDKEVKRYEMTSRNISIGRDESNDIVINHPSISKIHAEIYFNNGQFYVKDKNSMNGTFVNEIRVPEAKIVNHAYLRIGGVQALLVTDYSLDSAVGYEQPISNENILNKLRKVKQISPSQAAAIKDDMEMKKYTVAESAIMKGYFTPADWMGMVKQFELQKDTVESKNTTLWLLIGLANLALILLGVVLAVLYFKK